MSFGQTSLGQQKNGKSYLWMSYVRKYISPSYPIIIIILFSLLWGKNQIFPFFGVSFFTSPFCSSYLRLANGLVDRYPLTREDHYCAGKWRWCCWVVRSSPSHLHLYFAHCLWFCSLFTFINKSKYDCDGVRCTQTMNSCFLLSEWKPHRFFFFLPIGYALNGQQNG